MPPANPHIAERFRPFGNSIFAEISALALKHNAVNLAQGFPDFDGPSTAREAAIAAIHAGHSQYARMIGVPPLNVAIAQRWEREGKGTIDPESQVTVTVGCSEAIMNTLVGMLNPGDECITFEPYFDFYSAGAAMAGATLRAVTLHPPRAEETEFWFDPQALRAAITPRTRIIILNTPHNPTGKVFSHAELRYIADLCIEHNLVCISDEVYDQLVFDGDIPHISIAMLDGMRDRTITLNSLGKTFSLTGWKVGWAIASPQLSAAVRACHQFVTFSGATPMQHGAAAIINAPGDFAHEMRTLYRANRDTLTAALRACGMAVYPSNSTYFIMADHSSLGYGDDRAFVTHLIEKIGVAAIPPSVFYHNREHGTRLVRFAFCKRPETIAKAVERLQSLKPR
jgi:L-glutamine---4-(methylsulfanyl)-2-oxobutanoate aminotransferase